MGYQFADTRDWKKQAKGAFTTAIIAVITTLLTVVRQPDIGLVVFFIGLVPVLLGITRGIHYMNRTSRDYIFLRPNELEINRGPLLPIKRANYNDIEYCVEYHDHNRRIVTIKLIDNKEITFHGEWLTENDYMELKKELVSRTGEEKLFRFRARKTVL